jgi:hypothetical protein
MALGPRHVHQHETPLVQVAVLQQRRSDRVLACPLNAGVQPVRTGQPLQGMHCLAPSAVRTHTFSVSGLAALRLSSSQGVNI